MSIDGVQNVVKEILEVLFKMFSWLGKRPSLEVRISRDDPEQDEGGLTFEVENRSHTLTSLSPVIDVRFLTVERQESHMVFDVRELDRSLPPFEAKSFSASARDIQPERFHGWFRIYQFRPSKGPPAKIRIRNALMEKIGAYRFWREKAWFRLTGRVSDEDGMDINQYRVRQRSRGPH